MTVLLDGSYTPHQEQLDEIVKVLNTKFLGQPVVYVELDTRNGSAARMDPSYAHFTSDRPFTIQTRHGEQYLVVPLGGRFDVPIAPVEWHGGFFHGFAMINRDHAVFRIPCIGSNDEFYWKHLSVSLR